MQLLGGKEKLDARLARAREGQKSGQQAALGTFESTRPAVGAMALGTARAAYEWSLDYAKERHQFGRAIIDEPGDLFMLANMKTEIDAARLLVWRAAWMAKKRKPFLNAEGSMSKLKAAEVACLGDRARDPDRRRHRLRPGGAAGALAPRRKIYTIFEGTSEIQQLVIARAISGMHLP